MNPQPKPETSQAGDKRERAKNKLKLWQKVRKQVLERDKGRCRVCHSRKDVEVHHIRFRSRGGDHCRKNLACLCQSELYEIHQYRLAIEGDANLTLKVTWL